jgi:hypothetical protein
MIDLSERRSGVRLGFTVVYCHEEGICLYVQALFTTDLAVVLLWLYEHL